MKKYKSIFREKYEDNFKIKKFKLISVKQNSKNEYLAVYDADLKDAKLSDFENAKAVSLGFKPTYVGEGDTDTVVWVEFTKK